MRNYRKMNGTSNVPHRRPSFWEIASAILRFAPRPSPLWRPDPDASQGEKSLGRRLNYSDTERRANFIKAYNRNAMNFLPGAICHGIYAVEDRQSAVEARARKVLERSPELFKEAKARGYTG